MSDLITTEGSFEWAMLQLKEGKRVAREGWNGKNMYLLRNPGLTGQSVQEGDYRALAGVEVGTEFDFLPNIEMCNAQGNFVPWVSSQADVAAMDWHTHTESKWMLIADMTPGEEDVQYYGTVSGYFIDPDKDIFVGECEFIESSFKVINVRMISNSDGIYGANGGNHFLICCGFANREDERDAHYNHFKGELTVMVDGIEFLLGDSKGGFASSDPSVLTNGRIYNIDNHPKLIKILKDFGVKRRFYFDWKKDS